MTDDDGLRIEVVEIDDNRFTIRAEARLALPLDRWGQAQRPTEAEARESHRIALIDHDRLLQVWAAYDDDLRTVATIAAGDPLAAKILALHEPEETGLDGPVCTGCPGDSDYGQPSYPCETVTVVVSHHGARILHPDRPRPDPDNPPTYQDPADWEPPQRIRDLFPGTPIRTIGHLTYSKDDDL